MLQVQEALKEPLVQAEQTAAAHSPFRLLATCLELWDGIMAPKQVYRLIRIAYRYITLRGKKRLCRCNWFKDLKMTGYPRLSGWTWSNHKHISKWKARKSKGEKKDTTTKAEVKRMCFKNGGNRPRAKETKGNVGGGKGRKQISLIWLFPSILDYILYSKAVNSVFLSYVSHSLANYQTKGLQEPGFTAGWPDHRWQPETCSWRRKWGSLVGPDI